MNLPKSPKFIGNFCKGVKIIHFSCEIILGNFYKHLAIFYLVTLNLCKVDFCYFSLKIICTDSSANNSFGS